MVHFRLLLACASLVSTSFSAPWVPCPEQERTLVARNLLSKRTEPRTGNDLPDTPDHPNQLDQVETAFNDALELASYAINHIDTDTTIFPHYFDEGDRAGVKNVFVAILGTTKIPENPTTGNDLLGNIRVQTTDPGPDCTEGTLAYMRREDTDRPYIVLCPNAFNKKAVTELNGADNPADNPDDAAYYISCEELQANGHVSYLMNSLGATLLHEYTHYDQLTRSIFGDSIVDQEGGYGPVNVYDSLDKAFSPLNADSYVYYASEVLWSTLCTPTTFEAPRSEIDDEDPDCGEQACRH